MVRFEYDGRMSFQHCVESQSTDEVFSGFDGWRSFQRRLLELYGADKGNELFLHVAQHLLEVAEREYVTNARRREKAKKKKS
jgi:hypothetical protein